jgi:hypothetical protein
MKRKIYQTMLRWKHESQGKSALFIDGARRVGKSYIVEEFAKKEYKSYVLIDFNNTTQQVRDLFMDLTNLDNFFLYLGLIAGVTLHTRETLVIFDEVQLYPKARAAIKYLIADGRYDYIETGSLVSIGRNTKGIVIPSEEEHIKMYPMDFEEFLWALGEERFMDYIRLQFSNRKPMGQDMHRKAMTWFRQYMIVGGMPQAVLAYSETRDFNQVDRIKRLILSLYRLDIKQYAEDNVEKTTKIFDEIPSQLQRHEKKYRLGEIQKDARYRDFDTSFMWLSEAMVVNLCYCSSEPNIGFRLTRDGNTLKCYMADTGLLISHAFDENEIVGENLYRKLMLDKLEINEGMLVENIVAQMLLAAGHQLYFFSNYSKTNSQDTMEIDFEITKTRISSRHNVIPIEVKSGKNYTLTSLNKFRKKYADMIGISFIIHTSDFKEEDDIVYLPIYMTPLL